MNLNKLKKIIREEINSLSNLNEQFTGWNEQGMAPLTGTCPAPSLTINSPEELAQIIGYNPAVGPDNMPAGAQLNISNQNYLNQQINDGETIKIHSSVWPFLNPPLGSANPFEGYGWASPIANNGVAMEPQIPAGYINSEAAANYNPEYLFINRDMGLSIGGMFRFCQYTQADAFCLMYGYGHTGYCPAPGPSVDDLDPGVAPQPPTGMVTGMPGTVQGPVKGPISPTGPMAMKPKMPRRMNEQVERMRKLANIKNKK